MKISVTDKGMGVMSQFAQAINAKVQGRFIYIPKTKGEGYITGFSWLDNNLRMMVRNYYLDEEIIIERTNEFTKEQDDVIFLLSGIFNSSANSKEMVQKEHPNVFICMHEVSSVMNMPSNTLFRSITIAVSRKYLRQIFGDIQHPVVSNILKGKENFAFETIISSPMIKTAGEMLNEQIEEPVQSQYYKIKCEELLCYIFSLLMQREALPTSNMHIDDLKAIYAIKFQLQSHLDQAPQIAILAKEAGMSEPKLRKLFKQTFGKGVFEYYQSMRMQQAARLLKDKRLSVSEVGYQLGFTNLSHFSRVFEQNIGMKPKKYSTI